MDWEVKTYITGQAKHAGHKSLSSEFGRLTTDVISSIAFGIDAGCFRNPNSPFLMESKKALGRLETLPLAIKIFGLLGSMF